LRAQSWEEGPDLNSARVLDDAAKVRIVVADDHQLVADGVSRLLVDQGFDVVACAYTSDDALAHVLRLQPDILLVDVRLPPSGGLAVARALRDAGSRARLVVLTAGLTEREALEARQAGIRGVVLKEMPTRQLVQAIRKVHAGGDFLEMGSTSRAIALLTRRESSLQQLQTVLTAREIEVLRAAATGAPNAEIAKRLSIGSGTVKMHLYSIYKKLRVTSRVELMMYSTRNGITE
jgi:two-component system nitrate/nitrite response regulator NarL